MRKGQSTQFRKHFDTFVCEGDSVSIDLPGGYRAVATIVRDENGDKPDERDDGFWPSRDPNAAGYIGDKSDRAFFRAQEQAQSIMDAWLNDEWFYCGVCVTVEKNGVRLTGPYDHALWGVDCNWPGKSRFRRNSYLLNVANELLPEALEAARNVVVRLAA